MSPTLSVHATYAGVILGTAAYMSPEQARGKAVDKRTDVWAFGCVLFEMLSGARPFDGEDVAETMGAVIHKEPAWTRLPAGTPAAVRRVLQRCLEKDPKKRLRDISSVELLLEEAPAEAGRRRPLLPWLVAGTAAVVAVVALLAPWRSTRIAERPLVRLDVDLGSDVSLGSPQGTDVIISPDGNRLVFVSQGRLFTRRLDQPKAVELAGTQGAFAPFFHLTASGSRFLRWDSSRRSQSKVERPSPSAPPQVLAAAVGARMAPSSRRSTESRCREFPMPAGRPPS